MKTFSHLWQYLAKFFLEWEMFQTKVVEKIKTHVLCSVAFFRKSHRLWYNVEKCDGNRGATDDVTIWRIRVACWESKATSTYAHAHAHAHGYPYARAHRPISNNNCFSMATMIRERASMLRDTYIVCLVSNSFAWITFREVAASSAGEFRTGASVSTAAWSSLVTTPACVLTRHVTNGYQMVVCDFYLFM